MKNKFLQLTFFLCFFLLPCAVFASSSKSAQLIPVPSYKNWEAPEKNIKPVPLITDVKEESPAERSLRLREMKLGIKDMEDKKVFKIKSSTIQTDMYKPVRFMMREHSIRENMDCAICHHKAPAGKTTDPKELRALETTRCESCHQGVAALESPDDRLSLKGAYHQRCIGCHKQYRSDKVPVYCTGCHQRNKPDHEKLFKVVGDPEKIQPTQVTELCLNCHKEAGNEVINSAHYRWHGQTSKWTVTKGGAPQTGKATNAINNNCISPFGDWAHCTKCHVGYGVREGDRFSEDPRNVDCLVCHAEEDTYGKGKKGMPADDVDLVWVAGLVGHTSRANCGACHFSAGGGNARKGAMYNALQNPDVEMDVHMGGESNLVCADCHKGRQHRIPGRHSSVGVDEGIVECTDCHADKPHAGNKMAKHLDRHVNHVQCGTCHIPKIFRQQSSRDSWDWRDVGKRGDEKILTEDGRPAYLPDEGTFQWHKNYKPTYYWDNGYTKRYLIGDKIDDLNERVYLGKNLGSYNDPSSQIAPFKIFQGWQPVDAKNKYLVVPHISGEEGVWETKKWKEPIEIGMKDVGLPFSGEVAFVATELRFRPKHEVAPKENALTCVQCHTSALKNQKTAADTCIRCHYKGKSKEIEEILLNGEGRDPDYLPWKELGYTEDPIITGGRFSSDLK